MDVTPVTEANLQYSVSDQYERLGNWAEVGRFYGVHRAVVWRIVNDDYMPRDPETRHKLGLPEIVQQEIHRDAKGRFAKQSRRD